MSRFLLIVVSMLAVTWAAADPRPARAHNASLEAIAPADGARVSTPITSVLVRYSAAVTLKDVQLTTPDGDTVAVRPIGADQRTYRLPVTLTNPGTYTLKWRVPQADGHSIGYTRSFVATPAATATQPAARSLPGVRGDWFGSLVAWLMRLVA